MAPKSKRAQAKAAARDEKLQSLKAAGWTCFDCQQVNDADDGRCIACDTAKPRSHDVDEDEDEDSINWDYWHCTVGEVITCETLPSMPSKLPASAGGLDGGDRAAAPASAVGGSGPLRKLTVDIGEWAYFHPLTTVTAANNVDVGDKVIFACEEAKVWICGRKEELTKDNGLLLRAGIQCHGLVCTPEMLGWDRDANAALAAAESGEQTLPAAVQALADNSANVVVLPQFGAEDIFGCHAYRDAGNNAGDEAVESTAGASSKPERKPPSSNPRCDCKYIRGHPECTLPESSIVHNMYRCGDLIPQSWSQLVDEWRRWERFYDDRDG